MMDSKLIALLALGALMIGSPALCRADALPFARNVRAGTHGSRVRVSAASEGGVTTLSARLGGREVEARLFLPATTVSVEQLEVARGHHLAVLRFDADGAQAAALVGVAAGRPTILWHGLTSMVGDPGERSRWAIRLEDRTGDNRPDAIVGLVRENASICGQAETLLAPMAYDPASQRMRPVVLRRLPADPAEEVIEASPQSPGPTGPPLLTALRFTAASSALGRGAGLAPDAPRMLGDGDPNTFWAEGRGGSGRYEYVTARWQTQYPIRAFALTFASSNTNPSVIAPQSLWIVGESGRRIRVIIPPGTSSGRVWIMPAEARDWHCISVVLDQPRDLESPAPQRVGLAEVEAFTELDFGDGIEALGETLVADGARGDEATRLLSRMGTNATQMMSGLWPRLSALGRRRAVRVWAATGRQGEPNALGALVRAAREGDLEVQTDALTALGNIRPEHTEAPSSTEALLSLVNEPGTLGDGALASLSGHPSATVVPGLLAALSTEDGPARPTLRRAIGQAVHPDNAREVEMLHAWVQGATPEAIASLVLGLSARIEARALTASLLIGSLGATSSFEASYRMTLAAARLDREEGTDAWLARLALDPEQPWMLRERTLWALGERGAEATLPTALEALTDEYPRVRVRAANLLGSSASTTTVLRQLLLADSWPMVRAAAASALWDRLEARRAVRRAAGDRSPRVRVAAVQALSRAGDRAAYRAVRARLNDEDEWPQVLRASLHFVHALCIEEAGPDVMSVVRRGLRPGAWAPDVEVAAEAAIVALSLGGESAEEVATIAARPTSPAAIRAAVQRRQAAPAPCRAPTATAE